jgi:hypothetical protein
MLDTMRSLEMPRAPLAKAALPFFPSPSAVPRFSTLEQSSNVHWSEMKDRERGAPMFHVRAASSLCNLNEDEVLELIEGGELRWCFNIAIADRKKELRILPECVLAYLVRKPQPSRAEAFLQMLPHDNQWMASREVYHLLNCGQSHWARLARMRGVEVRKAPNEIGRGFFRDLIKTETFVNFLLGAIYPKLPQ